MAGAVHHLQGLPDGYDGGGDWFQTKSFPDACLCRYTITRAGRLIDALGNDLKIDGYLTFYTSDPSLDAGHADHGCECHAHFVEGQLRDIVRVARDESDRRCGIASFRWFNTPSFMSGDPDDADMPWQGIGEDSFYLNEFMPDEDRLRFETVDDYARDDHAFPESARRKKRSWVYRKARIRAT